MSASFINEYSGALCCSYRNITCDTNLVIRFNQDLVVFAQCHQKHDGGDVFEAVDPLASLWPLAAHVHHSDPEESDRLLSASDGMRKQTVWAKRCLRRTDEIPEYDALQVKRVLDDPCGGHSDPEHILLRGHIWQDSNPIQWVQVAGKYGEIQLLTHSLGFESETWRSCSRHWIEMES